MHCQSTCAYEVEPSSTGSLGVAGTEALAEELLAGAVVRMDLGSAEALAEELLAGAGGGTPGAAGSTIGISVSLNMSASLRRSD